MPHEQLALPVLTAAMVTHRLAEIAFSMKEEIAENLQFDTDNLGDNDLEAIHRFVTFHIEALYDVLNDVAPIGWFDPRRQAKADIRALRDMEAATAQISRNLKLYLQGRATQ